MSAENSPLSSERQTRVTLGTRPFALQGDLRGFAPWVCSDRREKLRSLRSAGRAWGVGGGAGEEVGSVYLGRIIASAEAGEGRREGRWVSEVLGIGD